MKKRSRTTKSSSVKIKFHNYQKKGISFLTKNKCGGLLWAPGLGKTLTILETYKRLKKKDKVDKLVIFAKLRICHLVWPKEIKKWGYDFNFKVLHGKEKEVDFNDPKVDVFIINYDGIEWLEKKIRSNRKWLKRCWLVLDESSKVKATKTRRFKIFKRILKKFDRRSILTGSPVPNGMQDIFGQIYILDRGKSLGEYITQFRNTYFYPSGYMGYEYKLQDGAEEKIYKEIRPLVLRFGHELLDLPKIIPVRHEFDLSDKVLKAYKDLESDFIAEVDSGVITASNAAVASGKLRQMSGGGIYLNTDASWADKMLEDAASKEKGSTRKKRSKKKVRRIKNKEWEHMHDEKIEELKEIVEELNGDPMLVSFEFGHELERLLEAFPGTPFIAGGVSSKDSIRIESDWNKGKLPLLFGHPESIAHGLNLQESGYNVCFFSMTWNLENWEQLIQRVCRQGQKAPRVFVHYLIARNTIDEWMIDVVGKKDKTQQSFLKAMENNYGFKLKKSKVGTGSKKKKVAKKKQKRKSKV